MHAIQQTTAGHVKADRKTEKRFTKQQFEVNERTRVPSVGDENNSATNFDKILLTSEIIQ